MKSNIWFYINYNFELIFIDSDIFHVQIYLLLNFDLFYNIIKSNLYKLKDAYEILFNFQRL
jgi:hypothetical protein